MRQERRWVAVSLVGIVLLGLGGCDGSGAPPVETSREEATVSGVVRVKGKTAGGGDVSFDASRKGEPARTAKISPEGNYSIKTFVGANKINVRGPDVDKANLQYNSFDFDVKSGDNKYDLDVK
jgi:hypothetical protein